MAAQMPGADNQSTSEQAPPIPGPESETSVARHVDLSLNAPTSIATYNPYMLVQQSYSTYQNVDSQQQPQQGYGAGSVHGGSFYTAPQELHPGYQEYHLPVQEQGYPELQQPNYMQQVEGYVQSSQATFETRRHQGQMQRILPQRLPHMRQRIRRRNRTNRSHINNVHSVAANMVYNNNREHSTATSITGTPFTDLMFQR